MRRFFQIALALFALLTLAVPALGETRALLIACSDFISQPDLGSAISGNLHMIGSALLGADPALSGLSIEDGTIGNVDELRAAIDHAFGHADEKDLSILYLCTHGVLSSADDEEIYLLLGNGKEESPLSGNMLCAMLSPIGGEKLLILDACHSGALIHRGMPEQVLLPGTQMAAQMHASPFLADTSIHVLTSASGSESSWYYDSEHLQSGAVSYFASALSSALGLYGTAEADLSGDGFVSLAELERHLNATVPSSSCQLLSSQADSVLLPTAQGAMLSRPLSGFSYGASLLTAEDPTLHFSFTVTSETAVQYRLVEYENGAWNWAKAQTFMDEGEDAQRLSAGRHQRSLTLPTVKNTDSGYLMLQVFSVSDDELILCSERLIGVQPEMNAPTLSIHAPTRFTGAGVSELPIDVSLGAPAEITVSIYDAQGGLIHRLASSRLTRPSKSHALHLYWDGRDAQGSLVPDGTYTLRAETRVGFARVKATAQVTVSSGG